MRNAFELPYGEIKIRMHRAPACDAAKSAPKREVTSLDRPTSSAPCAGCVHQPNRTNRRKLECGLIFEILGARTRARTWDLMIKSASLTLPHLNDKIYV
jgi:hypothetical protein